MAEFNLKEFGFSLEQRPNYMLMQAKIMERMVGPDLSEEDWVAKYSQSFRELIGTDPDIARRIAAGDDGVIDTVIARLEASPHIEPAAA